MIDWRRPLVYTHRWLGIAGCVLFIIWFISGIVMMYARMPLLTAEERLMRLPALDLTDARVALADVARTLSFSPDRLRIGMLGDRAVYRFASGSKWTTVFADTGRPLDGLTADEAIRLARRFMPEHASTIQYDAHLADSDQWTLLPSIRALMPMHRMAIGDADGSYVYISDRTGEAVMKTTRRERVWAYLGAIPHWIYLPPVRRRPLLWDQSIVWMSLAGCLLCLSGLAWGIWRYSPRSRYRLKRVRSHSPYAGLMWWHHYAGLVFGLVTFTWILSGLLSMTPWDWTPGTSPTREQREAVAGGPLRLDLLTTARVRDGAAAIASSLTPKELEVVQFQKEPFLLAYQAPPADEAPLWTNTDIGAFLSPLARREHRLASTAVPERGIFARFENDVVLHAARLAMPGTAIEDATWLQEYDSYYYNRYDARPLPVLRVRYTDPQRTWLYLDPHSGLIAHRVERRSRLNRWLYNGLHSLDFPFLYHRPLWDLVVIVLSAGGIALSATTVVPAWRRLRRLSHRFARGSERWTASAVPGMETLIRRPLDTPMATKSSRPEKR